MIMDGDCNMIKLKSNTWNFKTIFYTQASKPKQWSSTDLQLFIELNLPYLGN